MPESEHAAKQYSAQDAERAIVEANNGREGAKQLAEDRA
jgi:hypothetical protein